MGHGQRVVSSSAVEVVPDGSCEEAKLSDEVFSTTLDSEGVAP